MENRMNHFIGWRFGVPVKVQAISEANQDAVRGEVRLIAESSTDFIVVPERGGVVICHKNYFSYELIPYKYGVCSPRYPVCQSPNFTAYCNSRASMNTLDSTSKKFYRYPAAVLVIDGKTIELSEETAAEIKKKLGI